MLTRVLLLLWVISMLLLKALKQFHEQVQVLTKNLGSLNAIYELELQDTNNHLKAMNSFYGNLVTCFSNNAGKC